VAPEQAAELAKQTDLARLIAIAGELRDAGHGSLVSYSKKVFLPLTHLCRDVCHYCVFAQPPKAGETAFMGRSELLEQAQAASAAGCKEALFTLGDKPELRYKAAREGLQAFGHETTLAYLREAAQLVFEESGLIPHLNPGLMTREDFVALRPVSASIGIMVETVSDRLSTKGEAHYGSPDKVPARRLEIIRLAGDAAVPFTSGLLIGIGETRLERVESLLALRDLHEEFGHIQEITIQNFRAKPNTRMAEAPEPDLEDLLWTIAVARIVFGPEMSIQAPPNLSPGVLSRIVEAGINDWGGVSPLTPDFVNPEAPWPHLDHLARETEAAGKLLVERLTVYPKYALEGERWLDDDMRVTVLRRIDTEGYAHVDEWCPGTLEAPPETDLRLIDVRPTDPSLTESNSLDLPPIESKLAESQRAEPQALESSYRAATGRDELAGALRRAVSGEPLDEASIVRLFAARGNEFGAVCEAANDVRSRVNGDVVTYVVNRNINYTNVCYFRCQFCAFSKGKMSENLRGRPYRLDIHEVVRRSTEAWERGATEVCMQGGIHPEYTGKTYLDLCSAVKEALPEMHVHAFSPLEVWQGAQTLDVSLEAFLQDLQDAGLGTLPGTAAEILDDEVRDVLCLDKINTEQWLEVMETAHHVGFRTTSTIMYGHMETSTHWARHLLRLRALQARTGGFTEFVPLPFVHMEAPMYLKGRARRGPTFREAVLMHAVARLALHPHFTNIQTSWVKMGRAGVKACLSAGVNDLGGTLMNESITRAAGSEHGQELDPAQMEDLIRSCGRVPQQGSTSYSTVPAKRVERSLEAPALVPPDGPLVASASPPH
jgi:FO synthase